MYPRAATERVGQWRRCDAELFRSEAPPVVIEIAMMAEIYKSLNDIQRYRENC